jgi:hypothetical protein
MVRLPTVGCFFGGPWVGDATNKEGSTKSGVHRSVDLGTLGERRVAGFFGVCFAISSDFEGSGVRGLVALGGVSKRATVPS